MNDSLEIVKYLAIGHAYHTNVFLIEEPIFPFRIPLDSLRMDISIHFDRQLCLQAIKIQDEFSDRRLPTELITQRITPQACP